jgi:hypothetical protein
MIGNALVVNLSYIQNLNETLFVTFVCFQVITNDFFVLFNLFHELKNIPNFYY